MADEQFHTSGNWWDNSSRTPSSSSSSSTFNWSSIDSVSVSGNSVSFHDSHKLQPQESTAVAGAGDPNLHMMGWNQTLLHGDKSESGFRSNSSFQQEFQMGYDQSMNYSYPLSYGLNNSSHSNNSNSNELMPQFLRNSSPPKQPLNNQLHFSNNAPFWNTSSAAMNDVRSSFFPAVQSQFHTPSFDDKPKITQEIRDPSPSGKKSGSESSKRSRTESPSPSPLPAFKVRKEKMGDRITALQQLVSPFGKTDTASVLSEAIEYIKFLHEQVTVLSNPYMKSGPPMQHQQNFDNSNDPEESKQDLKTRGLCLVPVSSIFPVTHETTVDFWTPTSGVTFR